MREAANQIDYLKVREGLDTGAIGAQAGWAEKTVDDMVKTYSHSADERRLDDIDERFGPAWCRSPRRAAGAGCGPLWRGWGAEGAQDVLERQVDQFVRLFAAGFPL